MKEEAAEREKERNAEIEKYNKQKIMREEMKLAEEKRKKAQIIYIHFSEIWK